MSEFESGRNMKTIVAAVVVIAIVSVSGLLIVFYGGLDGNGTTTTTTTTTIVPKTLTIITRHDIVIHNVFEPAFLASDFAVENGITDIVWRTPSAEFWDTLINQGEIDVCWGGGPTLFDQLMRDGLLAPLTSGLMQNVSDRVEDTIAGAVMKRYDDNTDLVWIAAAISSFGFTINTDFLTTNSLPVPTNWTDLAKPIYGQYLPTLPTIAMGNAPGTTSNTRIYEIMAQALGWDEGWTNMARMVGSANIYAGSVETQSAVEVGDVGVAMSIDFYGYLSQARHSECQYIAPEDQTIINGDPIAIAEPSTQKDLAEGFVDFVLSPEGQALWLDDNVLRMPVMREAFDSTAGAAHPELYEVYNQTIATVGIDFNDTLSLEINAAFVQYWGSVFTDAQQELVDCWVTILNAFDNGWINETELDYYAALMGAPVIILDPATSVLEEFIIDYARRINNDIIYDATYKAQVKTAWTLAAKSQYNTVEAMVPTS